MTPQAATKKFYTFAEQLSYDQVRKTLLFTVVAGVLLYIALMVMSTATIAHSKSLSEQIRFTQGEITELNGALTLKNQDLALQLQNSDTYVTPDKISYIEKKDVLTTSLALDL